jgi:GlpG protein
MRLLGRLPNQATASQFTNYLYTLGIECVIEPTKEPVEFEIWVRDEDHLVRAGEEFILFQSNPNDERYASAEPQATKLRQEKSKQAAKAASLKRSLPNRGLPVGLGQGQRGGLVTILLTIAAIAVTLGTDFASRSMEEYRRSVFTARLGQEENIKEPLASRLMFVGYGDYFKHGKDPLASLKKGELWRLFTPALLHLGVGHALFNIMALLTMGSLCERMLGQNQYTFLLLTSHLLGTLMQALLPWQSSPFFGGLSGIVYGIFGYLWIRPLVDRSLPNLLTRGGIVIMLAWCCLGFLPFFPVRMANWAHLGGLLGGIVCAQLLPFRGRR